MVVDDLNWMGRVPSTPSWYGIHTFPHILQKNWMMRTFCWPFLRSFDGTGSWSNLECQLVLFPWPYGKFSLWVAPLVVGFVHIHSVLIRVDLLGSGGSDPFFVASRWGGREKYLILSGICGVLGKVPWVLWFNLGVTGLVWGVVLLALKSFPV